MFKTCERAWSPYLTGVIIGLLVIPAMVIADTAPNPSDGFLTVVGRMVTVVEPTSSQTDTLANHLDGARNWWQAALLAGIALGALLSATLARSRRHGPSPVWPTALGTPAAATRALTAFAGGFLMLLGATLAGGDFIGHGLSGVAQLALSSVITLSALIVGGLAVGRLLRPIQGPDRTRSPAAKA